ncbi:MAG: stage III sporulation protein D [Clostridia bacterium]|nr:stage III sporulation protein D [Clostridia bacterium]
MKKDEIRKRVIDIARYYINNETTVRATAKKIGVSKTTVHNDLRKRLREISPNLFSLVCPKLEKNALEAPRRGGLALQKKKKGKK